MRPEDTVFGMGNPWGLFATFHQWLNHFMHRHEIPLTHPFVYEFKDRQTFNVPGSKPGKRPDTVEKTSVSTQTPDTDQKD